MRIRLEVERGKGLVSTFVRGPLIEIWIGMFISIVAFYLGCPFRVVWSSLSIPGNWDEVPENFKKRLNFLIGLRQAHARQATDFCAFARPPGPAMPVSQPCLATLGLRDKKDAASALPDAVYSNL